MGVAWIPALLVAILGGLYVIRCLNYLASPGHSIEFEYLSNTGPTKLFAKSYSIDMTSLRGSVFGLELQDSKGKPLATINKLDADMRGRAPQIRIDEVRTSVRRAKDGSLDFGSILPKTTAKPQESGMHIEVKHAVLDYFDEKAAAVRKVRLQDTHIDQGDGRMLLSSNCKVDNEPEFPLTLLFDSKDKVFVKTEFKSVDIAQQLDLLRSWLPEDATKSWKDLNADRMIVTGPFSITASSKDAPTYYGDLQVEADNVRYTGVTDRTDVRGTIQMSPDISKFQAKVYRNGVVADVDGGLSMTTGDLALNLDARAASLQQLPEAITKLIPKNTIANGLSYKGSLATDRNGLTMSGKLVANSLNIQSEKLQGLDSDLVYGQGGLTLKLNKGQYEGVAIKGWADWNQKTDKLTGFIETARGQFTQVAAKFGAKNIKGTGSGQAIISGTLKNPEAEVLVRGEGSITLSKDLEPLFLKAFEARGHISSTKADVSRLTAKTDQGFLAANGQIDFKSQNLNLKATLSAFDLSYLNKDLEGTGYVESDIIGTIKNPLASGRAEIFGLTFGEQSAPLSSAKFLATLHEVQVSEFEAIVGAGYLSGAGSYNLDNGAIAGDFTGKDLLISEWLDENVTGQLQLSNGKIKGTIEKPFVTADASVKDLIAYGVKIDDTKAAVTVTEKGAFTNDISLQVGTGSGTGTATFDFTKQIGSAQIDLSNLPLSKIALPQEELILNGLLNGKINAEFGVDKDAKAVFDGTVKDITLNGTNLGSGPLSANFQEGILTGNGMIGSIERYLQLNRFSFDTNKNTILAETEVYNFNLDDLTQIFQNQSQAWSVTAQEAFMSARGSLSGIALIEGDADNPDVSIKGAMLDKVSILGRDAGNFRLSASHKDGLWTLTDTDWKSGDASFSIEKGTLTDKGEIDFLANLTNFDISWINTFYPESPTLSGKAAMTVLASGNKDNPTVQASLSTTKTFIHPSSKSSTDPADPVLLFDGLNLDEILLENKVVSTSGRLNYKGLTGIIKGNVPFSAFDSVNSPNRQPMSLSMVLDRDRQLSEFKEYVNGWDKANVDGSVNGGIKVDGFANDLHVNASLDAVAGIVQLPGLDTALKDGKFSLKLIDQQATLTGQFASDKGGSANFNISASNRDLFERGIGVLNGTVGVREFLSESALVGEFNASNLNFRQRILAAEQFSTVTASGAVKFGGDLFEPRIRGNISVAGLDVTLPPAFPEGEEGDRPMIDPIFEGLQLNVGTGSKVRFGLGQIEMTGNGNIQGPLSTLNFRAPLTVEKGQLRLPNARISLEDGGTVELSYRAGNPNPVAVNVNLEGQTRLTARKALDQYETYEVTLYFRGNLLDPNGLQINAISDPPDLSKDTILGILGQRQLFEALEGSILGRQGAAGLLDPLYQYALPSLTEGFTGKLAASLGLDYVTLDYNPFDQAIARAGKSFGGNFLLQASRQLSEPAFGRKKYELKLTYRLPVEDKFFGRVRLGFGTDQERPWKLTLDWARRF